ncbi:rod shape-determining protein MreD [Halobacteroides halobius DSM 5150]|uniref:Rod shape-determining protein MreD n=1 Tax=Halobacteroides halobius (strain ATCC 35273 / DSM 5150 / MD-1) TaxID=748449 RepID=L0K9D5_HALHC|nr:rod shape-determining protein MreD [Halobacteroides halobius]AGB41892.1 rod shape-determining protein MreD [Halobacteroides halobius DSM 5150]
MFYLVYGFLTLLFFIVQSLSSFQNLFYGVAPDLLLILLVFLAVNYGKTAGGIAGFIMGLLQDLFSGGLFGINAICKALVGYLFGFLKGNIYQDKLLVPPFLSFLATVINQLLIISFANYLLMAMPLEEIFRVVIIPLGISNATLSVIIYPILYKLGGSIIERESRRG